MAQPTQQVEAARTAVRSLLDGIAGMDEAKEALVDLGGLTFVAYLDETAGDPPEPIYDISAADVLAALVTALDAVNAVLDANNGQHRKALRKLI